jgi:hypothetical protein
VNGVVSVGSDLGGESPTPSRYLSFRAIRGTIFKYVENDLETNRIPQPREHKRRVPSDLSVGIREVRFHPAENSPILEFNQLLCNFKLLPAKLSCLELVDKDRSA